jgi:hypothetical protein
MYFRCCFSKEGDDEEYKNNKINKYKNSYGENNIVPCIYHK